MLGQSGHFHCAIGQVSLTGFPTSFEVWDKSFAMEEKIGQWGSIERINEAQEFIKAMFQIVCVDLSAIKQREGRRQM